MAIATPPARLRREPSDERLVARVRAGDEGAFARIFDRHSPGLLSFCRHMLGSREEAEDAVQQVFLSAHRAIRASQRDLHLRPWLYAIARNRCLSALRARREHESLAACSEPSVAGLAAEVERREDLRALLADLRRLPDEQRAALVLAELGAHSHDEIAQILDVRREKVKALVFQAREALIGARQARDIPCAEIREQLSTLRGGALRRAHLRRHLDACPGCREFRAEVVRQRAALALLLPVVPPAALKASVLGGSAAAAAGTGLAVGAAGSGLATGAKGVAAKLLLATAVAGTAGGGGYVAVKELRAGEGGSARATEAPRQHARSVAVQAAAALKAAAPVTAQGSTSASAHARRVEQGPARAAPPQKGNRRGPPDHHETGGRRAALPPRGGRPAVPPGLAKQGRPSPARRPAVPPGLAKKTPTGAPPGLAKQQRPAAPAPSEQPPAQRPAVPPGLAKQDRPPPPGQAHRSAPPPGAAEHGPPPGHGRS